ncbi:hypothetical protein P168DRAFT_283207 [Aspergillus campestris IBT 28561]|uniref:Acetyltransferase n=1 Tax=Aspergillus campestris (strain IBT 28561) TaxID=1392248 RepID=A0A2I1CXT6_ASPC2|nr:uncharacterized protein P168DRAFT_283207 [Aspergillus campestris IBT 28561]PKY02421.1 hypothetical protein P168DRAFT_283207 [Aspergillus campestris IBT 28561]
MDSQQSTQRVRLTAVDHTQPKLYVTLFASFILADIESGLQSLQAGVKTLFSEIDFLAGDVVTHPELEGRRNVRQIHPPIGALADVTLLQVKPHGSASTASAILESSPSFPDYAPFPALIAPTERWPVLRFQANLMRDGIVLAMSFNHAVFDATGATFVLQALSECCRAGGNGLKDTELLSAIQRNEISLRQEIYQTPPSNTTQGDVSNYYGPAAIVPDLQPEQWTGFMASLQATLSTRKFLFPASRVEQLKAICSDSIARASQQTTPTPSSNTVISALLITCIRRILAAPCADTETAHPATFVMPVNLRGRLKTPRFKTYLGNMITALRGSTPSTADVIDGASEGQQQLTHLARLSLQIHQGLESIDEQHIRETIAFLQAQDDWSAVNHKPADIILSSWRHLGVYDLDFGAPLGFVDDFEMDFGLVEPLCFFMPKRRVRGGGGGDVPWEVHITLKKGKFDALLADPLFGWILGGDALPAGDFAL